MKNICYNRSILRRLPTAAIVAFAALLCAPLSARMLPEAARTLQQEGYVVVGTVVDESGDPLIGVSITTAGEATVAAITDIDGRYRINVSDRDASLVFSYIGFASQTVPVEGRSRIDVVMKEAGTMLNDVVVTAMGIRRKESSLTYATQQVNSSDLNRVQELNVANSLEGKVAGITITPSAGGAGGSSKIILRGDKSILGSSTPLIVVDGVPMQNSTRGQVSDAASLTYSSQSEGADALSMLNPDDIESINVLKGANAAALYGSVAANGVLMITTKKGREGKMSVNFSSNVTFDSPLTKPEIQNVYGASVSTAGTLSLYSWGDKVTSRSSDDLILQVAKSSTKFGSDAYNEVHLRNYAKDDLEDFYRTGVTTNNSISLSGGTDKVKSYFSYANSHSNGMLQENSYNRNSFSFRQNYDFLDRFHVAVSASYIGTKTMNRPGGGTVLNPIYHMYTMPRNIDIDYYKANYSTTGTWLTDEQRVYTRNTEGSGYIYDSQQVELSGVMQNWAFAESGQNNPYWLLYQNNNSKQTEDRFFGNISGTVDLWYGFSFQARFGWDYDKYESSTGRYATTWLPAGMEDYGRYWWSYERTTDLYTDYMLNFNRRFGDFDVSATLGWVGHTSKGTTHSTDVIATYVDPKQQSLSTVINWFSTEAGSSGATTTSNTSDWDKGALFTAQVGWRDKVYVDGSYRRDWYRAFRQFRDRGTPEDYGYFGIGANAIVSSLLAMPRWMSYLKYRASYSEVGNSLPNQVYTKAVINYATDAITVSDFTYFEDPRPEKTRSFETGVEMLFFDNALSLDVTYYNSTMSNLYLVGTNASGKSIPTNSAKVRNQGVEASIGYHWRFAPGWSWKTTFNMAFNDNKILETAYDDSGNEYVISIDLSGVRVLYERGGRIGDMYVTELMRDDDGYYVLTSSGGLQTETESSKKYTKYVGNMNSRWQLGWSNTLTYKDFQLSFLINGRIGGKVVSLTEAYLDGMGLSQRTADARAYAEANNIIATDYGNVLGIELDDGSGRIVPIEAYFSSVGGTSPADLERYIYSGTNFRLRELSLGYTFRDLLGQNKNLTLSLIGRNLFFFYKDAPVDPDVSLSTSNGLGAFEVFNLPSSRSFGFSLNINF